MPAKKTVTLATKCAKPGQHRIQHTDAKTQKVTFPCRPKPKPRAGPTTRCAPGLKRKLVKVTSKKTGKVSQVWRCGPKERVQVSLTTPCKTLKGGPIRKRVQVSKTAKNGSTTTSFVCRVAKMSKPCKTGMSRVKITKGNKVSYTCRKTGTGANRACKPGMTRRLVTSKSGKKSYACRKVLGRSGKANTFVPLYSMFDGTNVLAGRNTMQARRYRAPKKRAARQGPRLPVKRRRVPLYMNANPTMTDIVNASDASLIRVLAEARPRPSARHPPSAAARRPRPAARPRPASPLAALR